MSLTCTEVATSGPPFDTVTKYVRVPFVETGSGESVLVIVMSARPTVVCSESELLPSTGSGVSEVTEAEFEIVPMALAVGSTVMVTVWFF